jgi:hypothetical protein
VSTTRARLQHLFGADFRFEFHRLHEGLAVVVAVPWHTRPREHVAPATMEHDSDSAGAERARGAFGTFRWIDIGGGSFFSRKPS